MFDVLRYVPWLWIRIWLILSPSKKRSWFLEFPQSFSEIFNQNIIQRLKIFGEPFDSTQKPTWKRQDNTIILRSNFAKSQQFSRENHSNYDISKLLAYKKPRTWNVLDFNFVVHATRGNQPGGLFWFIQ